MNRPTPAHLRRGVAVLAGLGLLATTAACGGEDEIVRVYSARHYDLEQAFETYAQEKGVDVEFLFGTDAELRERIAAEGEDTIADVYITVDVGNLAAAAEQGLFQPLESSVLDEAIPAQLRDPQDRWFGLARRARTIAYSTERVQPTELSTYEALTDPRWAGRLCLRQANSTYTQSLVASLIETRGEQETERIVSGWAANAEIFSNDVEIIDNIASGRCDVAIVNHYYLAQQLAEDPDLPVGLFWADQGAGEDGVHVNLSGAGVVAEAGDPEQAQALIEWLATEGQEAFVGDNYEYPANPDVPRAPLLDQFGDFRAQEIDATAYAQRNVEAVDLLARAGYE